MHRQVGIFMGHIHEYFPHVQRDGQFLLALPDKGLPLCLARLHLAANKLPQKAPGLVGRALADHELVLVPDQGCYYFGHGFHLFASQALSYPNKNASCSMVTPYSNIFFIAFWKSKYFLLSRAV